jgi:hypothetical protein
MTALLITKRRFWLHDHREGSGTTVTTGRVAGFPPGVAKISYPPV